MCKKVKSCVLLGTDPTLWSRTILLPPPSWFDEQLEIFCGSVEHAGNGRLDEAISLLKRIRSSDMREWFIEHGQMSGIHRGRQLKIDAPSVSQDQRDPVDRPTRYEKKVFQRDSYTCRYCGLRILSKEVLVAFERAVGTTEFCAQGKDFQLHGIVHGFKIVADHLFPHRCGGRTNPDNLVSSCPACNYGKYNYTLKQLGLDDPLLRPPANNAWDGLVSLVPSLKKHALQMQTPSSS